MKNQPVAEDFPSVPCQAQRLLISASSIILLPLYDVHELLNFIKAKIELRWTVLSNVLTAPVIWYLIEKTDHFDIHSTEFPSSLISPKRDWYRTLILVNCNPHGRQSFVTGSYLESNVDNSLHFLLTRQRKWKGVPSNPRAIETTRLYQLIPTFKSFS